MAWSVWVPTLVRKTDANRGAAKLLKDIFLHHLFSPAQWAGHGGQARMMTFRPLGTNVWWAGYLSLVFKDFLMISQQVTLGLYSTPMARLRILH